MYRIILASASPRRKEILQQQGIRFEVIPSVFDEQSSQTEPKLLVRELSLCKALEIEQKTTGAAVILGADTIVVHNGKILGKPKDEADATRMIRSYAGAEHEVFTGVTILVRDEDNQLKKRSFTVRTAVRVYDMREEDITQYIATREPFDKAGAYGIQGKFAPFIEGIDGDYFNVVGFPIAEVIRNAREMGVDLLSKEYSDR